MILGVCLLIDPYVDMQNSGSHCIYNEDSKFPPLLFLVVNIVLEVRIITKPLCNSPLNK